MGTSKERKGRGETEFYTPYKGKGRNFVCTRHAGTQNKKEQDPKPPNFNDREKKSFLTEIQWFLNRGNH